MHLNFENVKKSFQNQFEGALFLVKKKFVLGQSCCAITGLNFKISYSRDGSCNISLERSLQDKNSKKTVNLWWLLMIRQGASEI